MDNKPALSHGDDSNVLRDILTSTTPHKRKKMNYRDLCDLDRCYLREIQDEKKRTVAERVVSNVYHPEHHSLNASLYLPCRKAPCGRK